MKTLTEFKETLKNDTPYDDFSIHLRALWFDGKGDWQKAHEEVDQLNDAGSAHIHAYLHRKEGDIWNADYWYRRAQQTRPEMALDEEWAHLVLKFLLIN